MKGKKKRTFSKPGARKLLVKWNRFAKERQIFGGQFVEEQTGAGGPKKLKTRDGQSKKREVPGKCKELGGDAHSKGGREKREVNTKRPRPV